ncbi:sugar-binding transcriptional regulator [Azotosporobacter soli]|uniref:sugar-binding transcriptional regulator n=1 Tax=Azotosporobacter soli TaxID=3055040 RepID=UPI0031FF4510
MEDIELLCEVSRLYYENNMTQNDIAKQIHTSRPTVSRLLQEARDKGVVEIIIHYPWDRSPQLEQELISRFGLMDIRVLDSSRLSGDDVLIGVCRLAARYLQGVLKENTTLGLSWGQTMYHTIQQLRPEQQFPIKVIQLFGAANSANRLTDGPDLVRQLANLYGGECYYIHAPLFVENSETRTALLQDPHINETLLMAREADIALTGIGSLDKTQNMTASRYLDKKMIDALKAQGSIGHICAQHYDINGQVLATDIHQRLIGISLDDLHKIRQVIGVACGKVKVPSILGALRGQLINTLITDDVTARQVLELHQRT